jgi:predicted negative regulator of RcsB-dependent stress response
MATPLDLQEQEQLDELKAFWRRHGNLITWTLVLALAGYALWNGWNWYQRDQGFRAGALYDELERSLKTDDLDRSARIFGDLKDKFPSTVWAAQGGMLVAARQVAGGREADAVTTLGWVVGKAPGDSLRAAAALRLAGVHLDAGRNEEALKALDGLKPPAFDPLAADRRGDALAALGRKDEAIKAFQTAYAGLPEDAPYRSLVLAKLTALGAPPAGTEAAGVER